jgi:uncharacterized protein (DUF1501 family)
LLVVILIVILVLRRHRRQQGVSFFGSAVSMEIATLVHDKIASVFALAFASQFTAEKLATVQASYATLEVPRKRVKLNRLIGQGQSGEVYLATLQQKPSTKATAENILVAVKLASAQKQMATTDRTTSEEALQLEARLLHQLRHPHIVQVLAVVTKSFPTWVCLEYMQNGDLKTYLR